jgi:LacI family transcriptional regulator
MMTKPRIALIFPQVSEYCIRLITELGLYAMESNDCDLFYVGDVKDPVGAALRGEADGAILFAGIYEEDYAVRLLEAGIPVVNTSSDNRSDDVHCVYIHPESIARCAVDHLLACGYQHLAYVGVAARPGSIMRGDSLETYGRKKSGEVSRYDFEDEPGHRPEVDIEESFLQWIKALPDETGIVCLDDVVGTRVCHAAKLAGRSVPQQLGVVGVNDSSHCQLARPPLSSVSLPVRNVARRALDVLWRLLGGKMSGPHHERVQAESVTARLSTAKDPWHADTPDIQAILKLIEKQACHGLSVAEVVDFAPCSKVTLAKHFKAATGSTIGNAITNVRLNHARHLLLETPLKLPDIAAQCGYESADRLGRNFKDRFGITPSKYRDCGDINASP